MILVLALLAHACDDATDTAAVEASVIEAEQAVLSDDVLAHARAVSRFERAVTCSDQPVSAELWSRLLFTAALVHNATERPWEPLMDTALRVHPELDVSLAPTSMRSHVPDPTTPEPGSLRPEVRVDGREDWMIPPASGWHVIQEPAGSAWTGVLLRDAPLPAHFLAPAAPAPEPITSTSPTTIEKRRRGRLGWVATGAALGTLGVAAGLGGYAMGIDGARQQDEGRYRTARALNGSGYGMAGVGLTVLATGALLPRRN